MGVQDFESQQSGYLANLAIRRRCEFLSFLALLKHCDTHQHQAAYKVFPQFICSYSNIWEKGDNTTAVLY